MNFNEMKKAFRKTKEWKEFSKSLKAERKIDALTLAKLRRGSLCHHLDLRPENYKVLSPQRFETLNMKSHDVIHFLYTYYKKDPYILRRLERILMKMEMYNNEGSIIK